MIKRITKNYRTIDQELGLLDDTYSSGLLDNKAEEENLDKEDSKTLNKRIAKIVRESRKSLFKTVYDKQNPRKKLMYYDLILSLKENNNTDKADNTEKNGRKHSK